MVPTGPGTIFTKPTKSTITEFALGGSADAASRPLAPAGSRACDQASGKAVERMCSVLRLYKGCISANKEEGAEAKQLDR